MDSSMDETTRIEETHGVAQGETVGGESAGIPAEAPEAHSQVVTAVAGHIRAQSRAAILTVPSIFAQQPFSLEEEELAQVMDDLVHDEGYADIVRTTDERDGAEYLHSTTFLTVAYARHLIRAQADDPAYLIVQTVRENSEIYPRPTSLEFFQAEPFGLESDDVLTHVEAILLDDASADIKSVMASNEMIYLYSDRFLSQAQARAMAQWVEVDMYLDSNQ